ncbi:MAG: GNAT family N-acetyltransferase [Selenomonadaceae bacterium]|nr:GNAT family N-acetyltransferase [Selenomonadaceae bacterium]
MKNILIEGKRLRLRKADESDLKYILNLEYAPENLKFIVPFDEKFHTEIIKSDNSEKMDVIIEEISTGNRAGYFMLQSLDSHEVEWTHVIVEKKGLGYGKESFKLLMKWCFEVKKFHRGWLDCKDYNEVAIKLYESSGMVREGLLRDTLLTNGIYENLIVFGILDKEYFQLNK